MILSDSTLGFDLKKKKSDIFKNQKFLCPKHFKKTFLEF